MGMRVLMDWEGFAPLLRDDDARGPQLPITREGCGSISACYMVASLPGCGGFCTSPLTPAHLALG
jgi:hypothetical protein